MPLVMNAIDASRASRGRRAAAARKSSGVIIADDLTGAADACVAFVLRGLSGSVIFDGSSTGAQAASVSAASASAASASAASASAAIETSGMAPDVIAISTDSRGLPPSLAADRVGTAVRRYAARTAAARAGVSPGEPAAPWVFKKIDSTLRGPVGAEIDAAMHAVQAEVAIVAPAFPAMGRIVDRGLLRTTGPGAPPDIDIVLRLQEQGLDACARVTRPVSRAAWREALRAARRGAGRVLVCDSLDQADLDAITAAAHEACGAGDALDAPILWAGSAGLAHALAAHMTGLREPPHSGVLEARGPASPRGTTRGRRDARMMSIVFAIGSTHPVTVAQQERLTQDAMTIATARVEDVRAIEQALTSRRDVLVAMPHDASDTAVARFAALLIAREQDAPGSCALVLSGGDTAARLCRALGASRLDLGGDVATGMPWGLLSTAASPGALSRGPRAGARWPIALKAGGFGADDSLIRVRRFLMENHDRWS